MCLKKKTGSLLFLLRFQQFLHSVVPGHYWTLLFPFSVCCFLSLYWLFIICRLRIGLGPFILCRVEQLGMINRGHWRLCRRKWRAGRSRSSVSLPTHGLLSRHGYAVRNLEDKALGCYLCLKGPGFHSAVCFLLGFSAACLWDLEPENWATHGAHSAFGVLIKVVFHSRCPVIATIKQYNRLIKSSRARQSSDPGNQPACWSPSVCAPSSLCSKQALISCGLSRPDWLPTAVSQRPNYFSNNYPLALD